MAACGGAVAGPGAGASARRAAHDARPIPTSAMRRPGATQLPVHPWRRPRPLWRCVSIDTLPEFKGTSPMPLRNTPSSYGSIAKLLHWTIVILIITQVVLGSVADDLPNGIRKLEILAWHKSFGMLILMLALARLAWRFGNPVPAPPADMPR